jgi:alpha-L-arabinofuranosidase
MLALGNENWGEIYYGNLAACFAALSAYPYAGGTADLPERFKIRFVTGAGVDTRPQDTNEWSNILYRRFPDTVIDEHSYNAPQWFLDNARRYDFYDRKRNKVFMGEYAAHTESDGRGRLGGESTLYAALCEAAFLTGCERNSDVVAMTAYAPLFAKTQGFRWRPDLIWFDGLSFLRAPSYWIQKMFAQNTGDRILDTGLAADRVIRGGLFLGARGADILLRYARVYDKIGNVVYERDFRAGAGEWKTYPGAAGAEADKDGLRLSRADSELNGIWLDGAFGDCSAVCGFTKLSGAGGVILGLGVRDVRDGAEADKDGFSLWFDYGAATPDGGIAYEKRFLRMRTAFERIEGQSAVFSERGDEARLSLRDGRLTAEILREGRFCPLFEKRVCNSGEPLFVSATEDKGFIYIKVVNPYPAERALSAAAGGGHTAELILLAGEPNGANRWTDGGAEETVRPETRLFDFSDSLEYVMPPYSAAVFKIGKAVSASSKIL